MTKPAMLTPITTDLATAVGPRTFRKQLLRTGTITYKGQKLDFSPAYMSTLAAAFNDGAYDTVKFQLATDDNKHTDDPERMRATLKAVEVTGDGLDGIIEFASDDAAQLVRDHPDLGVSLRIMPGLEKSDGRTYPAAIKHVLGTIDPVVTGMRPWQAVDLAEENTDSDVDLTSVTFEPEEPIVAEMTDAQKARLDKLLGLPDEQFDALLAPPAEPAADPTEAEIAAALAALEVDANAPATEPAAAGAALSVEAQAAIDLANSRAEEAMANAAESARKVAKAEWTAERQTLLAAGVDPAALDLAAPWCGGDAPTGFIDLANTETSAVDVAGAAAATMRKFLELRKGTVDLAVHGESPDELNTDPREDPTYKQWLTENPINA